MRQVIGLKKKKKLAVILGVPVEEISSATVRGGDHHVRFILRDGWAGYAHLRRGEAEYDHLYINGRYDPGKPLTDEQELIKSERNRRLTAITVYAEKRKFSYFS